MSLCFRSLSRGPDSNFGGPFSYLLRFTTTLTPYNTRPKTLLRERGFSLGVLITSCTANSNLEYKTPYTVEDSETLRVTTPPAPRSSQVVQNRRIMVQTRTHPPGPENKTQPKARLSRDTFAMKVSLSDERCGIGNA